MNLDRPETGKPGTGQPAGGSPGDRILGERSLADAVAGTGRQTETGPVSLPRAENPGRAKGMIRTAPKRTATAEGGSRSSPASVRPRPIPPWPRPCGGPGWGNRPARALKRAGPRSVSGTRYPDRGGNS